MNIPVNLLPLVVLVGASMIANVSQAQTYQPSNRAPIADNSLGTQVLTNNNNFTITGGVTRGQNTFHSFQDFSVPTNGTATFLNPIGNQGIITRVTGSLFSDINGTVNTQGANFLLINPNGIVFGPSTQLNVGRVFAASTGNSVDLVDGAGKLLTFGVNSIGDAPLLAIDPQVIFNVSRLNTGVNNGEIKNFGTLKTNNSNQFIGLLGGNISLEGGKIVAPGGRVELGGLTAVGKVEVDHAENSPRWNFPVPVDALQDSSASRANISLSNQASIDVRDAGKGDIVVNVQDLKLSEGSYLRAGIVSESGGLSSIAGDIKVLATGKVSLDSKSFIRNNITTSGNGGNINIEANSLSLTKESDINIVNAGSGNTGSLILKIKDEIIFKDSEVNNLLIGRNGIGKSGNIDITANNVSLYGSNIKSSNDGQGLQGSLEINTKDNFSLSNSFVATLSKNGSVNNNNIGGDININSGSVILDNASFIFTDANRPGNSGNINLNARSLILNNNSRIASFSLDSTRGGGNIKLKITDVISIFGLSNIFSSLTEKNVGNSGDINIDTGSLFLQDMAEISSKNSGTGNSGELVVKASGIIKLTGESTISSQARGRGDSGRIEINAGVLLLDKSIIESLNTASGNSGDISIKISDQVNIVGASINTSFFGGGIVSLVRGSSSIEDSNGNSGNITIIAKSISSNNAFGIATSNFGTGKVGGIKLAATDFISLSGIGVVSVNSLGQKAGDSSGNITIDSPKVVLNDGFQITSTSSSKDGGNINISTLPASDLGSNSLGSVNSTTNLLFLRNGSKIITNAESPEGGNGGNININSNFVIAAPNENSDITATSVRDRGGKVNINSLGLFGIEQRPQLSSRSDITASSDFGQSGSVNISTLGNEPRKNTTELTTAPIDVSSQITQVCNPNQVGNQLHVTGRGGHPVNTEELLTNDVVWIDPRNSKNQSLASNLIAQSSKKIAQPATGWTFNSRGQVTLLASNTEIDTTKSKVTCPTK
jgi:filamentous hemagglutinin family protein